MRCRGNVYVALFVETAAVIADTTATVLLADPVIVAAEEFVPFSATG